MKNIKALLTTVILGLPVLAVADPPSNLDGWDLIFSDEFEGNSLDKSKWNPTYNWGHTHNHQAYCVEENVFVENGLLRIKGEAKRHPQAPATCSNGGNTYSLDYTSGAIDTQNKFKVKYGYIEGRFKMPKQLGTWPAFWTLQDGWPPEIDIFEVPHARTDHHYYLHYTNTDWYASHGSAWDHEASFGGVHKGPDKSADFHNYGLAWSDGNLSFYFDDKLVASYNRLSEISQLSPQYIIINLAIGGWATTNGNPIEVTSNNPAYLECDWVRVWQPKESSLKGDKVRLYSMDQNQCMQAKENDIVLGDCDSNASLATITSLGNGAYRINFGDNVVEIPNESAEDGRAVGLWEWNGKAHQQLYLQAQDKFSEKVVTLKFAHSNLYVQTAKGDVIQTSLPSNDAAYWRILEEGEDPTTDVAEARRNNANPSSIFTNQSGLEITPSSHFIENEKLNISIYTLEGRCLIQKELENQSTIQLNATLPIGSYIVTITGSEFFEATKIQITEKK
ncbi:MAG: family 16 glycosylhydrolase [Paludibacteraceae bacterium]|nr:family 16 glycosylhydrolase [Paludibacteraceae bacterium]